MIARCSSSPHITGGGITENLPRILPKGTGAQIELGSWPVLPIFEHLRELADVSEKKVTREELFKAEEEDDKLPA